MMNSDATTDRPVLEGFCTGDALQRMVTRGLRFGTIYADPPWDYNNKVTQGAANNHYDTMSITEICALPIITLAAADAHLHLWTTNAFLFECPKIFDAWGFEFKSSFIWIKHNLGLGNYWRNSHEFLLTAVRGKATKFLSHDHNLRSWASADAGRHSAKPESIRQNIERVSPGPRLELFGRRVVSGWVCWGNQFESDGFFPPKEFII